ncbi:MAG: hypothetical protein M3151_05320 [Actinomycetota bacterium]|nr:hypothetical protein [Actinomycetota bacterium]
MWSLWDGEGILIYSQAGRQKPKNSPVTHASAAT